MKIKQIIIELSEHEEAYYGKEDEGINKAMEFCYRVLGEYLGDLEGVHSALISNQIIITVRED